MLADHSGCSVIAQRGRLVGSVTLRDGIQECTGKHVASAVGVNGFDFFSWHMPRLIGRQYFGTFGTACEANYFGQFLQSAANSFQIFGAAPHLGFFLVAEQIINTIT